MEGEFTTGNYRLFEEDGRITFYKVYHSQSLGAWVVCDVPNGLLNKIDKESKRPLTPELWEKLQFWQ